MDNCHAFDTFFGKICESKDNEWYLNESTSSYIKFLERKVSILEDIVNTTNLIAELNSTIASNQSVVVTSTDKGVQTDYASSNQANIEYDCIQNVPCSFMVTDTDGVVELSESLISLNIDGAGKEISVNPWENSFYDRISSASSLDASTECPMASASSSPTCLPKEDNFHDNVSLVPSMSSNSNIHGSKTSLHVSRISSVKNSLTDLRPMDHTPVELIEDAPFSKFSINMLLRELEFSHKFDNRSAVYFGEFDYKYHGGNHNARDIPPQSYLSSITSYLDVLFPAYEYNSALVHLYSSGKDYIPLHCDDEDSIADDSYIITVSLGASRVLQVRDISSNDVVARIKVKHGDVFAMSKASQMLYAHEIVPDSSISDPRVSITFRLIKGRKASSNEDDLSAEKEYDAPHKEMSPRPLLRPTSTPIDSDLDSNESGYVPYPSVPEKSPPKQYFSINKSHLVNHRSPPHKSENQQIDTIYISSSMFRDLDPSLLSSSKQSAEVFFYPGANSTQMIQRLTQDPKFKNLEKKLVTKVFLLTGTNYVDPISSGLFKMDSAKQGINSICFRLWEIFTNAKLHIVNILPRVMKAKNKIVDELNDFIRHICRTHGLFFIDTELRNRLFSNGSIRKDFYFRSRFDDVHLNRAGVARLGKHLKYFAHL